MPMGVSLPLIEVNVDEVEVLGEPRATRGNVISNRELRLLKVQ